MSTTPTDSGSFDHPTDTDRWPATGRLFFRLVQALRRGDVRHDLVLELRRRDGVWDREAIGEAPSFNGELHEFEMQRGDDGNVWSVTGLVKPDPWVVAGGPLAMTLTLDPVAPGERGTYAGTIAELPVAGEVRLRFVTEPQRSRGTARPTLNILAADDGRLWDFSRAGQGHGEEPAVPDDLPVFVATDFGVQPDSGQECAPGIQAAIDAAADAGGGVVALPAGTLDYRVDGWQPPILVRHSRIIIRGAGSGPTGTLIVNHRYADHAANPQQPWKAGQWPMLQFAGRGPVATAAQMGTDTPPANTMEDRLVAEVLAAERGSATLRVATDHHLEAGKSYLLVHEEVAGLSLIRSLIGTACEPAASYRMPGARHVRQLVTVLAITGDQVTLDGPVHWSATGAWPVRLLAVDLLHGVGLTGLRLRCHWDGYFSHHKNPEHDNGWDQVGWQWCADGFITHTVHENATTAVGMGNCLRCTVADLRLTGNPGHNGICLGGCSTDCLLTRCDLDRPMHAINLSGAPSGNVIHDCRLGEPAGLDLHGGTGLDTLVDRLTGGVLVGGGSGNHVPPRHGPGLVLWNWAQGHYHPYKDWRRVPRLATWHDTPGFIAVGVHSIDGHHLIYEGPDGLSAADRMDDAAWVESLNQAVHPTSLYQHQRGS